MGRLVHMVAPRRLWDWPISLALWGGVAALVVYAVEWFWKPSAMDPPLEHYFVTMIIAVPLLLPGLMLIAHLDKLHREVARIAAIDPLTLLMNRRAFLAASEHAGAGALLMLDLDYFKSVNDSYGHIVGDAVLLLTAKKLRSTVRATDFTGRLGGEEFAVFLKTEDPTAIREIGDRLARGVVYEEGDLQFSVTASVGGALIEEGGHILHALNQADRALYAAKDAGRARFEMYQPTPQGADGVRTA